MHFYAVQAENCTSAEQEQQPFPVAQFPGLTRGCDSKAQLALSMGLSHFSMAHSLLSCLK